MTWKIHMNVNMTVGYLILLLYILFYWRLEVNIFMPLIAYPKTLTIGNFKENLQALYYSSFFSYR